MVDALGHDIKIGGTYGYSRRSNGVVAVIIGTAIKFNESSVSLEVLREGSRYSQIERMKEYADKVGSKRNLAPNSLFPVAEDFAVAWEEC